MTNGYTAEKAIDTIYQYLEIDENKVNLIDNTSERGFEYDFKGEKCVIFVYPISCKKNNKQNFFDTRDSGSKYRKIAWNHAVENNLKYFCLGVNSEKERYKDYIFSLESPEEQIAKVSYRNIDNSKNTGTQVNIPASFIPNKIFERICTPLGFYIAVMKKEYFETYLTNFDNRPYYRVCKPEKEIVSISENSVDFLSEKLDEYYDRYKSSGVHLFGYDYYEYFDNEKSKINDVIKKSCLKDTQYGNEIRKGINLRRLITERLVENKYTELSSSRDSGGFNKIYYGIPGCGKSYKVDQYIREKYTKDGNFDNKSYKDNVFRTTFYLDYSNSDFVGQLVPKTDVKGNIIYKPNFGPFTKALQRSYETDNMVFLVIEEINRGNAAAIFGDLFQLLDRLDEDKVESREEVGENEWKVGDSEYSITNAFIQDYLGIEGGKVIIPSNLTIIATMNTSDQNIFPLDTAFKRRWKMKRITNEWNENHPFANHYIPFTDITWRTFVETINSQILKASDDGLLLEDKQLGEFFADKEMFIKEKADKCIVDDKNKEKLENFTNKVVEYLYNDVFKFNKDKLFENKKSFNDIWETINNYDDNTFKGSKRLCLKIDFNTTKVPDENTNNTNKGEEISGE